MKKTLIIMMALTLTFGSQAQIGNLIGGAVRRTVEKKIEQAVGERTNQNPRQQQPQQQPQEEPQQQVQESRIPTPEEIMAMVPTLPTQQQLADYACETHRANPRTLRVVANPTSAFIAKMTVAMASGYVVMMGAGQSGSVYNFDEQLLGELGITQEQYDAMSEEEQAALAQQYAAELQERYVKTMERLAADPAYTELQDRYQAVERRIEQFFTTADSTNRVLWQTKYAASGNPSEADMCSYFGEAVPTSYVAVNMAMKMRRTEQLAIAKQMDDYVRTMAEKYPHEVYAGFFNQGGMCATAYVGDVARLTVMEDPR